MWHCTGLRRMTLLMWKEGHFKKTAIKHNVSKQQYPRKQWIFQEVSLHHLRKCLYMDYITFCFFHSFMDKMSQSQNFSGNTFFFKKKNLYYSIWKGLNVHVEFLPEEWKCQQNLCKISIMDNWKQRFHNFIIFALGLWP